MASVEATNYPGGPPGFVVRLERSDRSQIVRRLARWTTPAGLLFAALAVGVATRTGPTDVLALLTAACIGLSGLTLLMPAMYSWNERMTSYYLDDQWMAEYRGRRRDVVALDELEAISAEALLNVCVTAGGRRLLMPIAAVRPPPVSQLLRGAVQVAQQQRTVQVDEQVRALLIAAPALSGIAGTDRVSTGRPLSGPPRNGWDGVGSSRPRRRRGGSFGGPAAG